MITTYLHFLKTLLIRPEFINRYNNSIKIIIVFLLICNCKDHSNASGIDIVDVYNQLKKGNTEILKDTVRFENIEFEFGTSTLLPSDTTYLNFVSNYLIRIPTAYLLLVGYTDNVGDLFTNLDLSIRRAESVKAYLISRGIPKDQLSADGKGQSSPIADNSTSEGRRKNRRVELTFSTSQFEGNNIIKGNDPTGGEINSMKNSNTNAGQATTEERYRIQKSNGEVIDAAFFMFDEDGTIAYKATFSGDLKKLRTSEIESISGSKRGLMYDEKRVKEISRLSEDANAVRAYQKSVAEGAFNDGSTTIGIGLGTGVNYNYYGDFGFSPTFIALFDHGIKDVFWGTIGIGGIVGYRSTKYNYSYGGYSAKWTNILAAFRATYHINVLKDKNNKFDPYIGVMAGVRINTYKDTYYDYYYSYYGSRYSNYNYGRVNVISGGFLGAKYNFVKNFGVYAELGYDIAIAKFGLNFNF